MNRRSVHVTAAAAATLLAAGAAAGAVTVSSANAAGAVTWDAGYTATYAIANDSAGAVNSSPTPAQPLPSPPSNLGRALGQFAYYDAYVMHGEGGNEGFTNIRRNALARAKSPAQGGDETTYLYAFLDARVTAMKAEAAHSDTSRVDTAQRVFLNDGNLDLDTPLAWAVYGDQFRID